MIVLKSYQYKFSNHIHYRSIVDRVSAVVTEHLAYIKDVWRLTKQYSNAGYDYKLNLKTNYYIVSGHDIVLYLAALHLPGVKNFDHGKASSELMKQSFVKRRKFKYPDGFTTTYLIYAPKKQVDRWFKQNKNRFLTKGLLKQMFGISLASKD